MTRVRPPSPIVTFLGEDAGAGGPFALLGLPHAIASNEQIIRACNRRLQQVDCHRHRSTPDADEARLAIHSAATQLLDPALRAQLAQRWPPGTQAALPKAWKAPAARSRLSAAFVRRARMIVASSGGWNPVARKRLAHMARLNRVGALELVRALSPSPASAPGPHAPAKQETRRLPSLGIPLSLIEAPAREGLRWFGAYALLTIMALLLAATVLIAPEPARVVPVDDAPPTRGVATPGSGMDAPAPRVMRDQLTHYTAIAHELDLIAASAASQPGQSAKRFSEVYPQFIASWRAFPEAGLRRASLHIEGLITTIARAQGVVSGLAPTLSCPQDGVGIDTLPSQKLLRAAVLDVVLASTSLSPDAREGLSMIRLACSGRDPRPNVDIIDAMVLEAGLEAVESATDDPGWWGDWLESVRAITRDDEPQRTRLITSALTARLRADGAPGDGWRQSAAALVSAMSWREGSVERRWVLGQFSDSSIATSRLAVLTEALATGSGASGIDARMVLSPMANDAQRDQLARAYREAWFPSGAQGDASPMAGAASGPSAELIDALRVRTVAASSSLTDARAMESLLGLAQLNTAAAFIARGEALAAQGVLAEKITLTRDASSDSGPGLGKTDRDTQWAQEALNSESVAQLHPLLTQLISDGGPGVNSAHALVYLATVEADSEIREAVTAQIIRFKDTPQVLIALDHAISTARVTSRLEDLIAAVAEGDMPARTDPAWFDRAHLSLMAQLARALAEKPPSALRHLESRLGELYAMRAGELETPQSRRPIGAWAQRLVQRLRVHLSSQGRGSDQAALERIDAGLAMRGARASSSLQRFVAHQHAYFELRAIQVERSVVASALPVRDVREDLRTRLDRSTGVLDQMAQIERAIAMLWIIELERGGP